MRSTFGLILTLTATLALLTSGMITFARVAFTATGSGEIAFESNRAGNWDIYLLDLQTGITSNLTRSPADDFTPAWSPDGSRIAFISDRDNDLHTELYIVNSDGSDLRQITSGEITDRDPFWQDSTRLLFTHGWGQIYRLDIESRAEQWLGVGFEPHLAPDGSTLLYYREENASPISHVYTLNLENGQIIDMTIGTTHNWGGIWSPDGERIAFLSNRSGKPSIYTMNRDGSSLKAVTYGYNDFSPSWSPDGERIVFSSGSTNAMQLYIVNADGSNRRAITGSEYGYHAPAWRP